MNWMEMLEPKNTMTENVKLNCGLNSRIDRTEERLREPDHGTMETIQYEQEKIGWKKRGRASGTCEALVGGLARVSPQPREGGEKERGAERVFEEIGRKFLKFGKSINLEIREAEQSPKASVKEIYTKTHYNRTSEN